MKDSFENLIEHFPKTLQVLDVGCYGHEGANTSQFLAKHFEKVTGIAINQSAVDQAASNYEVIHDNFYTHNFQLFDLVVLDLDIENNLLRDWTDKGLNRMKTIVKPGGYLINYVMMTREYGDPDTPDLIDWHTARWWKALTPEAVGNKLKSLPGWELIAASPETRRPYILWTLLKRTDG